ncbi:MAG TPA: AAA family ATPase [Candidatus Sulfotelmatobacter sp.]
MKITNIYPRAGIPVGQTVVGNGDTIEDVFHEIRSATFDGEVVVPETHQFAIEEFHELLDQDRYAKDNVKFLRFPPIKQTVHVPAQGPYEWQLVRASDGKVEGQRHVPAQPATTKEITNQWYLDFATKQHALHIASKLPQSTQIVVIWEPYVEAGDLDYLPEFQKRWPDVDVVIFHRVCDKVGVVVEGDEEDWRNSTFSILELPKDRPKHHVECLIPEKALTMVPAPSYTGKTHLCIELGLSMALATDFLGHFKGPSEPVPVIYHVPELHASLFGDFVTRLNRWERLKGNEEMFLVRPLEFDLWQLDSPQMVESSRGRYVFLDTFGYFNDGDDSTSYNQAIEFAKKVNNLIRQGCLGVCGLYHPPKYAKNKKETGNILTLENQILGSAGYGGVLRSCLAMRNLHEDSNKGLWVYVQGLKNPGLGGPFQIQGFPLELVKKPGESKYLSELLKGDNSKQDEALAMLKDGKSVRAICKELSISSKTFSKWKQEVVDFDSDEVATNGTDIQE